MGKNTNTALFIIAATVLNVLLMATLFLLAYSVYQIFAGRHLPIGLNIFIIFLLFIGSVVGTYFLHKVLVRTLFRKTRIGRYLHPAVQVKEKDTQEVNQNGTE